MTRKEFECPHIDLSGSKTVIFPKFSNLEELYNIEYGKAQKMAYKLNEQVLHPQSIEKTNVKLADAAFHESTINALTYYAAHGYENFKDSAIFVKRIRNWFNQVNVKSADYGRRSLDERRNPIRRDTVESDVSYIAEFCSWLETWRADSDPLKGLIWQTFETAIHTCQATIALVMYLFDRYPELDFILLGNIVRDYLEGRFGWWRQLCGANYYNSVTQFLQAEKTICLRSLVAIGYDMSQIKSIFEVAEMNQTQEQSEEIKSFTDDLESFKFVDSTTLNNSVEAILYYIAGYIAKSLSKEKCDDCNTLISPSKVDMPLIIEELSDDMAKGSLKQRKNLLPLLVEVDYHDRPITYISRLCMHLVYIISSLMMKIYERHYSVCTIQGEHL